MRDSSGLEQLKQRVDAKLEAIRQQQRWRQLLPLRDSEDTVNLSHNDYLALRSDVHFQDLAWQAARHWPAGSGASRLLGGEHVIYGELEQAFSQWKGAESALYFSSGYAANEALMKALALEGACFFSDSLNHASLIDGMALAKLGPEQKHIFRHNDLAHLEELLQRFPCDLPVIVTESLFSMDGDYCPLPELAALARSYRALLVLDEAHSLGIVGPQGQGLLSAHGLSHDQILTINPCGKAMGGMGALIAGPNWFRDYLVNTARSFIFSTGPSPWTAAALLESVRYVAELQERRSRLAELSLRIRHRLGSMGFDCGAGSSHIIPVLLGSEVRALAAEQYLASQGIKTKAIRPPTVAVGTSRLRISLHAGLHDADLTRLFHAFEGLSHA